MNKGDRGMIPSQWPASIFGKNTGQVKVFGKKVLEKQSLLTLSLLMTTQEAFVDSVDQDQTEQNVQSNLWSTLSTFFHSRL